MVRFGADQPLGHPEALAQLVGQLLGQHRHPLALDRPLGHDFPEVEEQRPFVLP